MLIGKPIGTASKTIGKLRKGLSSVIGLLVSDRRLPRCYLEIDKGRRETASARAARRLTAGWSWTRNHGRVLGIEGQQLERIGIFVGGAAVSPVSLVDQHEALTLIRRNGEAHGAVEGGVIRSKNHKKMTPLSLTCINLLFLCIASPLMC